MFTTAIHCHHNFNGQIKQCVYNLQHTLMDAICWLYYYTRLIRYFDLNEQAKTVKIYTTFFPVFCFFGAVFTIIALNVDVSGFFEFFSASIWLLWLSTFHTQRQSTVNMFGTKNQTKWVWEMCCVSVCGRNWLNRNWCIARQAFNRMEMFRAV